jgi:hypothetical protein
MTKYIGRVVNINGSIGTCLAQNGHFVLIKFISGAKLVFNAHKIEAKEWLS